ncbi:MAG: hypothetical protein KKB03_04285 [Nanoarchaeota archaeon]|nr:hypothetical protein [Nanoarchaeota archaeon]MBU2520432.1 hypothetical protein [Nanoarchaeota archaeon]
MARFINIFGSIIVMLVAVIMGLFGALISMLFFNIGIIEALTLIPLFVISSIVVFIIGLAAFIYELTKKEITLKHENNVPVNISQMNKEKIVMVCSKCVTHNERDAKFCKGCGNALVK